MYKNIKRLNEIAYKNDKATVSQGKSSQDLKDHPVWPKSSKTDDDVNVHLVQWALSLIN